MRISVFILVAFLAGQAFSQGFRSKFHIPGGLNSYSKAIYETTPGNYFSAGIVFDTTAGINSYRLIVNGLNTTGAVIWTKKYGHPNCQFLYIDFFSRAFYREGNYFYYAGTVRDTSNQVKGILIKFNFFGDTIWQRIYSDPNRDLTPQIVTRSVDNGFLLTGFFQDWTLHTQPCLLLKTDNNGNELWRKIINKASPNVEDGRGIAQDSASKKIIIVGNQYNGPNSDPVDNLLILDSLGNFIHQSFHVLGILNDVIKTKDGKFIAVGINMTHMGSGVYKFYSYIFKFDVNAPLAPIWRIDQFGAFTYQNHFNCLTEMPNGDVLVAGQFDSLLIQNQKTNIWTRITRIDQNGVVKSNQYYDYASPGYEVNVQKMTSIELTSDGGWVGAIAISNPGNNPLFFVKYDSTGCDSTIAYCLNPAGIKDEYNVSGLEIYPNPATETIHVKGLDAGKEMRVVIYNSLGEALSTEILSIDNNEARINTSMLSPGIYFLKIPNNTSQSFSGKFIIAR